MAMTALFLAAAAFIALLPQESDADTFEITDVEWKIGNNAYLKVTWNVPINEGTITVYLGTDKIAEHEIPPSSTNVSVKVMNPVEPGFYTVHVKTDKGSDTVVKKYPEYTGDVNAFISEDIDGGVVVLLYCDGDAPTSSGASSNVAFNPRI